MALKKPKEIFTQEEWDELDSSKKAEVLLQNTSPEKAHAFLKALIEHDIIKIENNRTIHKLTFGRVSIGDSAEESISLEGVVG